MGFSGDLTAGVAQLLEDAGVGTWQPSGLYASNADRPIFIREAPSERHRVIAISHYPVAQAVTRDAIEGVQVRNRGTVGDPRPVDDDADAIRAALDGLEHVVLGSVHVSLIKWQSGAPLGQDASRRWEMSQNFYLYVNRPNTHRED